MSTLGIIITVGIVLLLLIGLAFLVKKLGLVSYYKELGKDVKDKK